MDNYMFLIHFYNVKELFLFVDNTVKAIVSLFSDLA